MRVFDPPNTFNVWRCPIGNTAADNPAVLVPIPGTERGGNVEARQIHAACHEVVLTMHMTAAEEQPKEQSNGN